MDGDFTGESAKGALRKARRKQAACQVAVLFAAGLVGGLIGSAIGGAAGLVFVAGVLAVAWLLTVWITLRFWMPRQSKKLLEALFDADAGPPVGAAPITLELAERWVQAVSSSDWKAMRAALDTQFVYVVLGVTLTRDRYLRSLRMSAFAYSAEKLVLDEVMEVPGAPERWVRLSQQGRARSGPDIDATWWETWILDNSDERLVRSEQVAVVRLG